MGFSGSKPILARMEESVFWCSIPSFVTRGVTVLLSYALYVMLIPCVGREAEPLAQADVVSNQDFGHARGVQNAHSRVHLKFFL